MEPAADQSTLFRKSNSEDLLILANASPRVTKRPFSKSHSDLSIVVNDAANESKYAFIRSPSIAVNHISLKDSIISLFGLKTPLKNFIFPFSILLWVWFSIFCLFFLSDLKALEEQEKPLVGLYRIIGNDLPPRHKLGQTISNLRFILDNEKNFDGCEKWWILNRVADRKIELEIIKLLRKHNQKYVKIGFQLSDYVRREFRASDFPVGDFFRSEEFKGFSSSKKLRVLDYFYHDKNRYVMNNNGARNTAIRHGMKRNEWILPFDGNSFITPAGWNELKELIQKADADLQYILVPMARLTDNHQAIDPTFEPSTTEEPQLIIRHNAKERYDERQRYGRRSKLELLWRLGIVSPPPHLNESTFSWEQEISIPTKAVKYAQGGFVFRLYSGQKDQEAPTLQSSRKRSNSRILGIQNLIDAIDESIAKNCLSRSRMAFFVKSSLKRQRLRYWNGDQAQGDGIKNLLQVALSAKKRSDRFFMLGETNDILKDDPHEKSHESRDKVVPLRSILTWSWDDWIPLAVSNNINRDTLQSVFDDITTLSLAWHFDGDASWALRAGNLVRLFIIESSIIEETALHNQKYYSARKRLYPDSKSILLRESALPSVLEKLDLSRVLDAVKILSNDAKVFSKSEESSIHQVFSNYFEYLTRNPLGFIPLATSRGIRGVEWQIKVSSLSWYLKDLRDFLKIMQKAAFNVDAFLEQGNIMLVTCQKSEALDLALCAQSELSKIFEQLDWMIKLITLSRISRNIFIGTFTCMDKLSIDLWTRKSAHPSFAKNSMDQLVMTRVKLLYEALYSFAQRHLISSNIFSQAESHKLSWNAVSHNFEFKKRNLGIKVGRGHGPRRKFEVLGATIGQSNVDGATCGTRWSHDHEEESYIQSKEYPLLLETEQVIDVIVDLPLVTFEQCALLMEKVLHGIKMLEGEPAKLDNFYSDSHGQYEPL